jgi:hypothetical protein
MAAPTLVIQEAPEMAAAMIHKKERPPTSATAPNLLVLLRTVDESHLHHHSKNFSCTI